MKKILAVIMSVVLLCGMFAATASATTKSDLLEEAAKAPVYKYIKISVENAARTIEITDEEAEALLPIVKKAVAAMTADNGPTYVSKDGIKYDAATYATVMSCIDEACAILGFTYKFSPVTSPKHTGDSVFQVFDENGKLVFEYDGDIVTDTAGDIAHDAGTMLFIGAAVLMAAGAIALVIVRRRESVR